MPKSLFLPRLFLAAFMPLLSLCTWAAAPRQADMARVLAEEALVGAVWSVVEPGGTATVDAAGLSHAGRGEEMRVDSRVHVGSIAKTLLAAGALRLVTEGRLALDAPVADLLPALAIDNRWATQHPLRVRHLLDHTAGLDDARLWQVFSLRAQPDTPLIDSLAGGPSLLRLRTPPGSRASYSNMGYTVLAMVIEAVVGRRYEDHLDTHLLQPLGMHDSSFRFVSQEGARADARLAMGHFDEGAPHAAAPSWLRPAGQFTTTAADMARFARFLMGDGHVDGQPFIDPALLQAMGTPAGTEAALAGLPMGYALGLLRRDRHGVQGRCHGGSTVGYRAMLCLFAPEQKAFFVAMNTDSETADHGRLDALLIKALGVAPAGPPPPAAAAPDLPHWQGVYVPAPARLATFDYIDTLFNFAHVDWDGTHMHFKLFQGKARRLAPAGGHFLHAHDRAAVSHVLLQSPGGQRLLSDGVQTFQQTPLWRMVPLWVSLAGGLLGLAALLVRGAVMAAQRALTPAAPVFAPFLAVLALLLPLPLFFSQSFLQIGDLTPASATLALVTATLPLAAGLGLWRRWRQGLAGWAARLEALALAAVLQWAGVLAAWGLLPLRLWA